MKKYMIKIRKIFYNILYGFLELFKAVAIGLLFAASLGGILIGALMLFGKIEFHWLSLIYSLFSISLVAWACGTIANK